jgi:hypothetical protein
MARLVVAFLVILSAATALGQTNPACPWVALGTAERLLGGEAVVAVHLDGNTGGTCRFTRRSGNNTASIEVQIGPMDSHPCPPDSERLKALGNEAVQCRLDDSAAQKSDRIAGRIRRVFFVVTVINIPGATKPEPSDARLADAYAASPLERLAEQVVGNLY